jgi:regulator of protease activity HflC (stomatin/prohibitin superfamily)
MGARGIIDKVTPFVQNRTIEVFGTVSALQITDQLIDLQNRILLAIQAPAMDYFGERIEDVQLTGLKYSPTFEANVEAMVQTRNQQIQAENVLKIRETEAKQAVATAQGQANSNAAVADGSKRVAIANAEGAAQQVRLQADAAAYSRKVQSEAEANAIRVIGEAQGFQLAQMVKGAGNSEAYVNYLRAQAAMKWDGSVPKMAMNAGDKGAQPLVVVPSDSIK